LARTLDRAVEVEVIAREGWEAAFRSLGFSEEAARSYARMTAVTIDELELPASPIRGHIRLADYVFQAARGHDGTAP
jgi:hypothetical protein